MTNISNLTTNLDKSLPAAASRLSVMPKVTPEIMMIVYLDEIAGRLAELQEQLAEVTAEGYFQGNEHPVTDNPSPVYILAKGMTIHNDGTNSVYMLSHKGKPLSNDAEIKKNEELDLDFGTRRRRTFYLVCASGETAAVRIFTW